MFDFPHTHFISADAFAFYKKYAANPLESLLLKFAKKPAEKAWAIQLEARRRAQKKIPTWYENEGIIFSPKQNLEQSSSEITAKYKAEIASFQNSVDLTGGTAIDSWQLAKKAKTHTLVEPNADLVKLAEHNLETLKCKNVSYFTGIAEDFITKNEDTFDLIYVDPSRRTGSGKKVIALTEYAPDVVDMKTDLLKYGKQVLIKVSPFADLTYLQSLFPENIHEIHVVAVQNECKEILLLLKQEPCSTPKIITKNFTLTQEEDFSFFRSDDITISYAESTEIYLFEPNAAILKAGAFLEIAQKFNLKKLDKNSHLYTATHCPKNFPGNIFEILETTNPYKLKTKLPNASIISRNFPDKPAAIRKRLKMGEGNEYRIFATTMSGKRYFIATKKIDT